MDNKWSGSEHVLLSQRPERANTLATSTRRRLVMKCTWSRRLTCKRSNSALICSNIQVYDVMVEYNSYSSTQSEHLHLI